MTSKSSLSRLLRPASVAIVGLSADQTKHGGRVLSFLRKVGFEGDIWGVHPKTPAIDGVEVYPSLKEGPTSPDAIILAVPPPSIPGVLEEAAERKAGGAIIFSGGFAEVGGEGESLQRRVCDIARAGGVRLLGPNSAGIIYPPARTILSFLTCLERPAKEIRPGPVGLITQSGGTGSFMFNLAADRGGGLAISVSTGNEADVELSEVFEALVENPDVRSIALLLETVRNGPRFIAAARAARAAGKPVVACKIGRTEAGHDIMRTHTGALAGPIRTFEAAFESLGITSVRSPAELLDVAEVMASAPLPPGDGVGVITHSGGAAILMADRAEELGITLPDPSPEMKKKLEPFLQMGASGNPVDLGGIVTQPERYGEVIRLFLNDPAYDLVIPVSTPHPSAHSEGRGHELIKIAGETEKPLPNLWLAGKLGQEGADILRAAHMPIAESAESLMLAVRGMIRLGRMKRADKKRIKTEKADEKILEKLRNDKATLSEAASKERLVALNIPVVGSTLVNNLDDATCAAGEMGYPVVLKINSPDLPHKSEAGGVRLNIGDEQGLGREWKEMMADVAAHSPSARIEGALVEEFAPGLEMILGTVCDETFGPMVLVGTGGVLAEALDDVALALAPVSEEEAGCMIASLRGRRLLQGFRGAPRADEGELASLIAQLSHIAVAYEAGIASIDLNPVVYSRGRWRAADALVVAR
ncbi:MAG: acetate--CoA ligase family protein [Nitrospinaceae bacterium]|nr:acetate--CoA ligase family protein [Nitrospinaceae bacterium]MBT3434546.1 acetate--CoA ligase family protein [Nitrospinaceae bacterium]MBT3819917.1 acetate--CoA ligase family protein [Nitrospinaceae bacterium]MBT4095705.1 acetate--CoA ligase family protein [Nitrospinaceae bacterium]MBT4431266.1 acetate--CoA ligase family protein [Nitrospinaceae bacterium]